MIGRLDEVSECVDAMLELLTLKMSVSSGSVARGDETMMAAGEAAAADLFGHDVDLVVMSALLILESVFTAASVGSGVPPLELLAGYAAGMRSETGRFEWHVEGDDE